MSANEAGVCACPVSGNPRRSQRLGQARKHLAGQLLLLLVRL
jgi:hypothetical protein